MEAEAIRHFTVDEIFRAPLCSVLGFVEKDYVIGLHSQEFYEINIVLSGSATHTIGQMPLSVGVGDTFIVPPSVPHAYAGGKGFDVYHILISPKFLEKHSADLALLPAFHKLFRIDPLLRQKTATDPHFCLSDAELGAIMPTLTELSVTSYEGTAQSAIIAGCQALTVIARLCGIYEERGAPISETVENDAAFLASIAYIYENFDTRITVDELARMARMSRTAYITKFKRVTGLPPARLQRQYRISVAKQLLSEGTLTETEIAGQLGFYDTSHFVRAFIAETGKKPRGN